MASKNEVILKFAGDTASLDKAFGRVQTGSQKTTGKLDGLKKGAKIAAAALIGGLAIAAKIGFDEFTNAQKITAQTNAVLKSTGGIANVTADDISALAGKLANLSGVDDDLIQSGANVLLTFKNIRNEAGKGNNIFDQATTAALDLSVAMGTDLKNANIQVGKALNDPIKGISALQRVGITFTQGQKDQIKALVENGETMKAQKIILGELESQFGGSAKAAGDTLAGQINKAKNTFANLSGEIVGALLPAFTSLAGTLNGVLGWMQAHQTTTKVLIGVLGGLAVGVYAVNAATKVWTASMTVLNLVMKMNPLGLVITAIALLAAGIVIAYKNSDTFRGIVQGAFNAAKTAINAVKNAVENVVDALVAAKDHPVIKNIVSVYTAQFSAIKTAINGVITVVGNIIDAIKSVVNSPVIQKIDNVFGTVFGNAKSVVLTVVDAIKSVVSWAQSAISFVDSLKSKASSIKGPSGIDLARKLFADGGVVTKATNAVIGEAGPEVVIPLTRPRRAAELLEQTGLASSGSGGGPTVNIQTMVVQDSTDVYRVASQLGRQLRMA